MNGHSHGQAAPGATSGWLAFTAWDTALLISLLATLAGYALLARRKRGGAGSFDKKAAAAFVLGLAAVFTAASSSSMFLKEGSHLGYMAQLELMMSVAPPLLLLGLRPLLARMFERSGFAQPFSTIPAFTLGVWLLTLYAWHLPALHMLGMHSWLANPLQLASYAVAGLLFWGPLILTAEREAAMSAFAKLGYLALAQVGAGLLAAILIFHPQVIYAHGEITQPFGLSAMLDQKASGAAMMVVDMAVASTVAGWIVLRALSGTRWQRSLSASSLRETVSGGWRLGVPLGVILAGSALILGTAPTAQPSADDAPDDAAKVHLAPVGGSGVSGDAAFTATAGGVEVSLDVRGLPEPGASYLAHIHPGECAEDTAGDGHSHHGGHEHGHAASAGEIAHPLTPVVPESGRTGESTTFIDDLTIARLLSSDTGYHVNVHAQATGDGETPTLACGDPTDDEKSTAHDHEEEHHDH